MRRITFEQQPGGSGYRVMEGRQEKVCVGEIRPSVDGLWMAYSLDGVWVGSGTSRKAASRRLTEPNRCPHGYTGNWSDDCPDCRH